MIISTIFMILINLKFSIKQGLEHKKEALHLIDTTWGYHTRQRPNQSITSIAEYV